MSGKRKRRSGGHEEESEERWLITYADMITLLMAFFIMMYSMSMVDLRKFDDLKGSMARVFGGGGMGAGAGEVSVAGSGLLEGRLGLLDGGVGRQPQSNSSIMSEIQRQMDSNLSEELRDSVRLSESGNRVTVSMQANSVTFRRGEASLTPQARQILSQIGSALRDLDSQLLVEGHTCDLPINTARFPSNWELSAARANNVMVFLIRSCDIPPGRISTASFAATRPLSPNTCEEHRKRNRRVDIVLLRDESGPAEQTQSGAGTAQAPDVALFQNIQIMPPMNLAAEYYAREAKRAMTGGEAQEGH